jgi:hypothetical protein
MCVEMDPGAPADSFSDTDTTGRTRTNTDTRRGFDSRTRRNTRQRGANMLDLRGRRVDDDDELPENAGDDSLGEFPNFGTTGAVRENSCMSGSSNCS